MDGYPRSELESVAGVKRRMERMFRPVNRRLAPSTETWVYERSPFYPEPPSWKRAFFTEPAGKLTTSFEGRWQADYTERPGRPIWSRLVNPWFWFRLAALWLIYPAAPSFQARFLAEERERGEQDRDSGALAVSIREQGRENPGARAARARMMERLKPTLHWGRVLNPALWIWVATLWIMLPFRAHAVRVRRARSRR